jgi:phosphoribosylanthranilate isomerase
MKIKVCGMTYRDNLEEVAALKPDFLGFIFHQPSPRFMANTLSAADVRAIDSSIKKVGVFVNEAVERVVQAGEEYGLDYAQLHGHESVEHCRSVKAAGIKVIKVFPVVDSIDMSAVEAYNDVCSAVLFDTKTDGYGGSGKAFDWTALETYSLDKPYFLSGGISPENVRDILCSSALKPWALDVNSQFEDAPGRKNIELIKTLIQEVRDGVSR